MANLSLLQGLRVWPVTSVNSKYGVDGISAASLPRHPAKGCAKPLLVMLMHALVLLRGDHVHHRQGWLWKVRPNGGQTASAVEQDTSSLEKDLLLSPRLAATTLVRRESRNNPGENLIAAQIQEGFINKPRRMNGARYRENNSSITTIN